MNIPKGIDLLTLMASELHLNAFEERKKGCILETKVEMAYEWNSDLWAPRVGQLIDKTKFGQTRRCRAPVPGVGAIWSLLWSSNLVLSIKK